MRELTERNEAVVAAYRTGLSLTQVSAKFGVSPTRIYHILERYDATPDYAGWLARNADGQRRKVTPEYRERQSARMRQWWAERRARKGEAQ